MMNKKYNYSLLQIMIVLAYVMMVGVNILAIRIPLNGVTTQEVSQKYSNLFTPAGITFSIWGLIYTLLLVFVLYSVFKLNNPIIAQQLELVKIGYLFIGTCLANSAWLFAWHYDYIFLSVIIMISLLFLLVRIYFTIPSKLTLIQYIALKLPFSVYLGWIIVATVANISAFLVSIEWGGLGLSEQFWTVVMMMLAMGLALVFIWKYHDIAYALVIAWALLGILIQHRTIYKGQYPFIQIAAYFGIGMIIANAVYMLWIRYRKG